MKELKKRWNAETPHFFKKVIKLGVVLGVVGGALITFPVTATAGTILVTIGTTATTLAKLTKI